MIRTQAALKAHLAGGGLITREFRHEPEPKTTWRDPATDQAVHAQAANWALAAGRLEPVDDGLFPGLSQTFRGV